MRHLSIGLAALLLVVSAACGGDDTDSALVADEAARVACGAWHEVLGQLGEEEFLASGEFLPRLDAIAFHATPSSAPGLAVATARLAERARAVVTTGEAVGYEETVREVEAACARVGLGLER